MTRMRIKSAKTTSYTAHAPLSCTYRTQMGQGAKGCSKTALVVVEGQHPTFFNKSLNSIELYRTGGISI